MYNYIHLLCIFKHTCVRIGCGPFEEDSGGSIAEWAVHHIGVSSDPSQYGHTSKHIAFLVVKDVLQEGQNIITAHSLFKIFLVNFSILLSLAPQENYTDSIKERKDGQNNLVGHGGIEQISGLAVHNSLRLVSGSRGVHDEEIVFTVH